MDFPVTFAPARRTGLILQGGLAAVLLAGGILAFLRAAGAEGGAPFLGWLALGLALTAPTPLLIYRAYGLLTGAYTLDREGLRLRWGLRYEDVPLTEIEWMRRAADVPALYQAGRRLALPFPRWPGALVGARDVEGLGPVEYLAGEEASLTLVATPGRIYALSPADPEGLIRAFQRLLELGSLTPLAPRSVFPTGFLARVWADRLARAQLLANGFVALALLAVVGYAISARQPLPMGVLPSGELAAAGPPERLLLLPSLLGLSLAGTLLVGLYFYRRPEQRFVAYVVWLGSLLEGVLLLASVAIIVG